MSDWTDEDGYPTDAALDHIKNWDWKLGWRGLFDFVGSIWAYRDWGWTVTQVMDDIREKPVEEYQISTGGWSGNESLIGAMQSNWMFWSFCWVQSRRGGHYIFHLGELAEKVESTAQETSTRSAEV